MNCLVDGKDKSHNEQRVLSSTSSSAMMPILKIAPFEGPHDRCMRARSSTHQHEDKFRQRSRMASRPRPSTAPNPAAVMLQGIEGIKSRLMSIEQKQNQVQQALEELKDFLKANMESTF